MTMEFQKNQQGKIVSLEDQQNGRPFTKEFQYNCGKELASVRENGKLMELYEYNQSGFRTKDTIFSRNIINRQHKYYLYQLVQAGDTTFSYDQDGRLVLKEKLGRKTQYGYSREGHLTNVLLPSGKRIDYALNGNGQRMAKYINGELVEKYHWAGLKQLAAYESTTMQAEFTYDGSGNAARVMINGAEYLLETNPVGTLRRIRNHIGQVVKEFQHDAFGNVLISSDKPVLPMGFAGGLHDRDTDLIHFGYREYIPDVGRWNRPDPLGKAGGDSDLYGYCVDDPVNVTDKSGLFLDGMFDFSEQEKDAGEGNSTSELKLRRNGNPSKKQDLTERLMHTSGLPYPEDNYNFVAITPKKGEFISLGGELSTTILGHNFTYDRLKHFKHNGETQSTNSFSFSAKPSIFDFSTNILLQHTKSKNNSFEDLLGQSASAKGSIGVAGLELGMEKQTSENANSTTYSFGVGTPTRLPYSFSSGITHTTKAK